MTHDKNTLKFGCRSLSLLSVLSLAFLFVSALPSFSEAKSASDEQNVQKEDYYSQDNWYKNFGKSFMIWKKDLRYVGESVKNVELLGNEAKENGWRKEGGKFFSAVKLSLLMVVFWLWVATSGWINNDTQRLVDLHRVEWNTVSVTVFPIAFIIILFIPVFWIGFPILFLAWLVPVIVYVCHRNASVLDADKVMTADHLVFLSKRLMGMDVSKPKQAAYLTGSPIEITASGNRVSEEALKGRTIAARNQSGFNNFKEILYRAIHFNAMSIRIESSNSQAGISFFIDGVWIPINTVLDPAGHRNVSSQETSDIIRTMKVLIGAKVDEHVKRQGGDFKMKYDGKKKMEAMLMTQGKGVAEEAVIQFQLLSLPFMTLVELGMTEMRQDSFRAILNAEKGMCVLSAAPGQGLRTFTNVAFNVADRFTRDFVTVEDVQKPYLTIENVTKVTYDSLKKETPMTVLPDVFFKEPKVLLLRDIINLDTLKLCCEEVANNRLIVTTFRGIDSADTIMRILKTGVPPKLLADSLHSVVTQRLIRRLCPECKEEIPAQPEILRRLGINPQKVKTLFRRRVHTPPEPGKKDMYVPCPHCLEIGYKGRAGVYDVITINDEIRQIITTNPSADAIRKAAAKAGSRGFFTDGAQLVADGITSFDEFRRFMQGGNK